MSRIQRLKKNFVAILLSVLSIVVLAITLIAVYSDSIGEKAIAALQQNLKTSLHVENTSISFFSYFPKTAIQLKGVSIEGVDGDQFLEVEQLAFKINLGALFGSKLDLQAVRIKGGRMILKRLKDGRWNYDIFKNEGTGGQQESYKLSINKAFLEHIELIYHDQQDGMKAAVFLLKAECLLDFHSEQLQVDFLAHAVIDHVSQTERVLLENKSLRLKMAMQVHLEKQYFLFKESIVELAGNVFLIEGSSNFTEDAAFYDLSIHCRETTLDQAVQLLPASQMNLYNQLKPSGNLSLHATYKGKSNAWVEPELKVDFNILGGTLQSKRFGVDMKNLGLEGQLKSSKNQTQVSFKVGDGSLQGKPIVASGVIDMAPRVSWSVDADLVLPLSLLLNAGGLEEFDKAKGDVELRQLQVRYGPKYKTPSKGGVYAKDLQLRWQKNDWRIPALDFVMSPEGDLQVSELQLAALKSDIALRGTIKGFLSFILGGSGSPVYELSVQSKKMDINALREAMKSDEIEGDSMSFTVPVFESYATQKWTLDVDMGQIWIDELKVKGLKGFLSLDKGNIQADWQLDVFGGRLRSELNGKLGQDLRLQGHLHGDDIDIQKMFVELEEFDQDFITSRHLKGKMHGKMLLDMRWDEFGNFDSDALHAQSAVIIEQGSLVQFPMMEEFAKFVKIEDLRNIRFDKLHNILEIKKGVFFLPQMFIQSNALNLNIAGTHQLDMQMDYALQVNAGQVLTNKFKKHNPQLVPIKAKQKGLFNIYYRISGYPENLQFTSDRKLVMQMMENSDRRRDEIRKVLIDHFGPLPIFFDSSIKALDFFGDDDDGSLEYIDF